MQPGEWVADRFDDLAGAFHGPCSGVHARIVGAVGEVM